MSTSFSVITHAKAKEFIERLDRLRRARVDRIYFLFEQFGPSLPGKYLKKVDKDVWEFRPGDVRLLLTLRGRTAIVVHGIMKKSQKLPKREIELANMRILREDH